MLYYQADPKVWTKIQALGFFLSRRSFSEGGYHMKFTKIQYITSILLLAFTLAASNQPIYADFQIVKVESVDSVDIEKLQKIKALEDFLKQYNSPLASYASIFVDEAYKNDLDWRLVAAISGVESTFGKAVPANSYNGWGWNNGNYTFTSWEEAITVISEALNTKYAQKWGAKTPQQIGRYYAASPTWAVRVENFMEKIEPSQPETLTLVFNL